MSSRGRESTKLCGNFALYITSIIMMLITILLMTEDRRNISCANNACYVHISFLICDENACKTNSVIYFNIRKTKIMVFARSKTRLRNLPTFKFGNLDLDLVQNTKYNTSTHYTTKHSHLSNTPNT